MYFGLEKKSLLHEANCDLYRGSLLNVKEIEKIKEYMKNKKQNLPSSICYSRTFLSFSKNKGVAEGFLSESYNKFSSPVFFIVKKLD